MHLRNCLSEVCQNGTVSNQAAVAQQRFQTRLQWRSCFTRLMDVTNTRFLNVTKVTMTRHAVPG
jgi:hypothetical protein